MAAASMTAMKSEIRDNMRIDWDAPIAIDDGVVLRADVFRPIAEASIRSFSVMGLTPRDWRFRKPTKATGCG